MKYFIMNRFKVYPLLLALLMFNFMFTPLFAQEQINEGKNGGALQLGLRSTQSMFNSTGNFGSGVGGQFRLLLDNQLNTDWFADYFTENLDDLGKRTDAHIGWSVVFYLKAQKKWQPYILAGHCFDYTRITTFASPYIPLEQQSKERWSSAVQAGGGMQWNLSQIVNFTFHAQYMLHLGKDIHVHKEKFDTNEYLAIEEHNNSSLEGHLLLTFAFNVKIAELW
tara:strand:+ start:69024 stop:69692 length:669 start_codon:yes stop_codon:yes gene_type:complete